MGAHLPPPPPLTCAEYTKRVSNGAKTLREIDPAFAKWCDDMDRMAKHRLYAIGFGVLIAVVIYGITCILG